MKKWRDTLLAVLFIIGISLPGVLHGVTSLTRSTSDRLGAENRLAAPPPQWTAGGLRAYTEGLNQWMSDHFGLRASLIDLYGSLQDDLGLTFNQEVIEGQDGWLFLNHGGMLEDYQGRAPHDASTLASWVEGLDRLSALSAAKDASFLVMIAPNKQSIYGADYFPPFLQEGAGSRRVDHLLAALETEGIPAIYPAEDLRSARGQHQAYFRTDTHWTGWGAYTAYRAAMSAMQKTGFDLAILPEDRLAMRLERDKLGDLVALLGHGRYTEDRPIWSVMDPGPVRTSKVDRPNSALPIPTRIMVRDPGGPTLLIIGDSFSPFMAEYFAQSFGTVVLFRHEAGVVDLSELEEFQPDVVLFEVVERMLVNRAAMTSPDGPQTD
ncbi:DHHW family protein [Parvularcula sp. LCG005]|uniref:DHHW family protein n=1 Tax=Parvularcula sp. LCG005 TaxID=3078805 RepID=UPI002941EC47|nr:DHHW family protein [Parvularcula sp. LCG005]WOI53141.1 DHHW family protein [Parvularcula sp. LCG005]